MGTKTKVIRGESRRGGEGARINRNKLFFGTFEFCFKWLFFVDDVLDAEIAGMY